MKELGEADRELLKNLTYKVDRAILENRSKLNEGKRQFQMLLPEKITSFHPVAEHLLKIYDIEGIVVFMYQHPLANNKTGLCISRTIEEDAVHYKSHPSDIYLNNRGAPDYTTGISLKRNNPDSKTNFKQDKGISINTHRN